MNITDLKEHMDNVIMKRLDHKNLDKDVSYFQNVVSNNQTIKKVKLYPNKPISFFFFFQM